MSRPPRYYIEVQALLRELFNQNQNPTTADIQTAIFQENVDLDSQYQRSIIWKRISEGRKNALLFWNQYSESRDFVKDVAGILHYSDGDVLTSEKKDFSNFRAALYGGQFGAEGENILQDLEYYTAISHLWTQKLKEYSQELNNLAISTYGKRAYWLLPSWWRWAVRETDLYIRSVKILQRQLKRGISTKLLTASGEPLEKALEYSKSIQGLLEDGDSWRCKCNMYNSGESNYCSNCGRTNPRFSI